MNTMIIFSLLDNFKSDLKSLHPADRLSAAARMMGRPDLVANQEYRQTFSQWRKGVAL
jgi:hypothetical protein